MGHHTTSMEHIVIIGNGISGVTAARHIRKHSNKKITIISAETEFFFSRTALMYVYMGHMKFEHTQPYEDWFWKKNRIELKQGWVSKIDSKQKQVIFNDGNTFSYDKLIIATGSKPNKFGWPGQDLVGVQGLYHKQDLENLEVYAPNNSLCKRAVIVGGGLIGIELAEMLASRNIPVTFLVRESSFWNGVLPEGESAMINRHIRNHHIDLRLGVNLKEVLSDENGKARAVVIAETGEEIGCDFVGLTAGVSPNIDFIKNSEIETNRGVVVNRYLETNVNGIYAIGDCAEQREAIGQRRPVEAVWYTGGWVFAKTRENEAHFHWKHEDDTKCITVCYDKNLLKFLGINTFGIRMRHEVFDRWLTEERDADFVMSNLSAANFDPEFYSRFEGDILKAYNHEFQNA